MKNRERALDILQQESKLEEIVRLVGTDALSAKEQLLLEVARMIREDFLFQNAYDPADAYTSLKKQFAILATILHFADCALPIVEQEDFEFSSLRSLACKQEITKAHLYEENDTTKFDALNAQIEQDLATLKL
jgi:V/A-type H+-transporting ATPase subunit A